MQNDKKYSKKEINDLISKWSFNELLDSYESTNESVKSSIVNSTHEALSKLTLHNPINNKSNSKSMIDFSAINESYADDALFSLAASPENEGQSSYAYGVAVDETTKNGAIIKVTAWVGTKIQSKGSFQIIGNQEEAREKDGKIIKGTPPLSLLEQRLMQRFTSVSRLKDLKLSNREIHVEVDNPAVLSNAKSLTLTSLVAIIKAAIGVKDDSPIVYSSDVSMDGKLEPVGDISSKALCVIDKFKLNFVISHLNYKDLSEHILNQYNNNNIIPLRSMDDVFAYHRFNSISQHNGGTLRSLGKKLKKGYIDLLKSGVKDLPVIERGTGTERYEITELLSPKYDEINEKGVICRALLYSMNSEHESPEEVILKIIPCKTSFEQDSLLQDANMMLRDIHPNIIKLKSDPFFINNEFFIPMEAGKSSLDQIVDQVSLNIKAEFAIDLIQAVNAIHKIKKPHGDIKLQNILIIDGIPKIADFGLATYGTPGYRHPKLIEACIKETSIDSLKINERIKWDNYAMGKLIFKLFCPLYVYEGLKKIELPDGKVESVGLSSKDINKLSAQLQDIVNKDKILNYVTNAVNIDNKDEILNYDKYIKSGGETMKPDSGQKKVPSRTLEFFKDNWGLYLESMNNMIKDHLIIVIVMLSFFIMAGIVSCAFFPDKFYEQLFIEFHYLSIGGILLVLFPVLFKKIIPPKFEKQLYSILLIIFIGIFIGAYITPWLYEGSPIASCSAKRIFRMDVSEKCCKCILDQCEEFKNKEKWDQIIKLVHGYDIIRAGISPDDPCYMNLFEIVAWARYAKIVDARSNQDIEMQIKDIQKEFLNILKCNNIVFEKINMLPDNEPIVKPSPYPKTILQNAKQWTHVSIKNKQYEILKPDLIDKINQAINKWSKLEKRRQKAWKINIQN